MYFKQGTEKSFDCDPVSLGIAKRVRYAMVLFFVYVNIVELNCQALAELMQITTSSVNKD